VHDGALLVLFGAATGRDGIGGVSVLASRTLEDDAGESRPSVQIGDPFAGKLLIEASLEMADLLDGLQDLGGAGLTCAASESAARAGMGAVLRLADVPLREPNLEPFEILTSESQERMLAIVSRENLDRVLAICARWGLEATAVGALTEGGRLRVTVGDEEVANVPASSLADEGPVYTRPIALPLEHDDLVAEDPTFATVTVEVDEALIGLLGSPNVASKRWVWEQYDSLVQGGTVAGPGGDAALVRIEGTLKALALTSDGKGRYGALDPYLGAAHAVAESARNVACAGATPLAITNCLNFGNPERPEVMWQFAESVRGIGDACRALETPVTGGNVSFYNESGDSAIWPTPVIGMLGLIEDYRLAVPSAFADGMVVYLLGETFAELGGSAFAETVLGVVEGRVPALDLERERALHRLLIECARSDLLRSAHDCDEGGLAVALAESAIAGETGFAISMPGDLPPHVTAFSESASRAVVSVRPDDAPALEEHAAAFHVPFSRLGETGGPRIVLDHVADLALAEAAAVYEEALPKLMAG
jgi:phosphoribosylformylglycinamidine synthase